MVNWVLTVKRGSTRLFPFIFLIFYDINEGNNSCMIEFTFKLLTIVFEIMTDRPTCSTTCYVLSNFLICYLLSPYMFCPTKWYVLCNHLFSTMSYVTGYLILTYCNRRTPKSVARKGKVGQSDARILGTPDYLAPELLLRKGSRHWTTAWLYILPSRLQYTVWFA